MDHGDNEDAQSAFESIAAQTGDVIVRVNLQGILTYVSPAIRLHGLKPEDLIGTSGIGLFHPEDQLKIIATTAALLRGESMSSQTLERRFRNADGAWVWAEGSPAACTTTLQ